MKVMVFESDTQEPIGIGDLCRYEDLNVVDDDDPTKVLMTFPDHPVIVMEDGEIIYGINCWWCPI